VKRSEVYDEEPSRVPRDVCVQPIVPSESCRRVLLWHRDVLSCVVFERKGKKNFHAERERERVTHSSIHSSIHPFIGIFPPNRVGGCAKLRPVECSLRVVAEGLGCWCGVVWCGVGCCGTMSACEAEASERASGFEKPSHRIVSHCIALHWGMGSQKHHRATVLARWFPSESCRRASTFL